MGERPNICSGSVDPTLYAEVKEFEAFRNEIVKSCVKISKHALVIEREE